MYIVNSILYIWVLDKIHKKYCTFSNRTDFDWDGIIIFFETDSSY